MASAPRAGLARGPLAALRLALARRRALALLLRALDLHLALGLGLRLDASGLDGRPRRGGRSGARPGCRLVAVELGRRLVLRPVLRDRVVAAGPDLELDHHVVVLVDEVVAVH